MVIVFGGAFNPPTVAHKEIYYHIAKSVEFSRFIFLPVSNLYTKSSLIADHHRLNMLKLLIKDLEKAEVSDIEMGDSDFLGTYQTLIRIQEQYQEDLAFVIGADNLKNIHNWLNSTSLLAEFKFIVINRNKFDIPSFLENDKYLSPFKDNFHILPDFNMNISSTGFRESFDPSYVTEEVYEYIMTHNLY